MAIRRWVEETRVYLRCQTFYKAIICNKTFLFFWVFFVFSKNIFYISLVSAVLFIILTHFEKKKKNILFTLLNFGIPQFVSDIAKENFLVYALELYISFTTSSVLFILVVLIPFIHYVKEEQL